MKEITLPSGKVATIEAFKGKHIKQAQKIAGDDSSQIIFAIIAQLVKIEGEGIVMEELDDMDGQDVLALMGEFGANFTSSQSS